MKTRLTELKERHAAEIAELEAREAICALLPDSLKLPTISNISEKGSVYAWLSFSPDCGVDAKEFALSVLTELEKAGAKPLPATLAKYGQWRRSVHCGDVESLPQERKGSGELSDCDAIAPLWVTPCQFTGVEARCFYELGGKVFKVSVKAPLAVHLSCRRVEYRGGWRFEGSCTVHFPDKWHAIYSGSESVAIISQHTRGYRDTEQGISGEIYWMPNVEQSAFPLTPAQMIAQLF